MAAGKMLEVDKSTSYFVCFAREIKLLENVGSLGSIQFCGLFEGKVLKLQTYLEKLLLDNVPK